MDHFMTSEEIAKLLHIDPVTVHRLVDKGELSAYRVGADYRFALSDLQNYLQQQRISAHAQNKPGINPNNPLDLLSQSFRKGSEGKHATPSELVSRFDWFTKQARHVLMLAQEEARRFQDNYISPEHMLLGLLREEEGVAAQVINNLGADIGEAYRAAEAIIEPGGRVVLGEVAITPRIKRVIELAVDEAQHLNHRFIGTEHLLLGLMREGEGRAVGVLKSFGLQMEQVRTETLRVLSQHQQGQEETSIPAIPSVPSEATTLLAENESGLLCASCGAYCPGYFRYCFNCGQPLIHEEELSQGEEE